MLSLVDELLISVGLVSSRGGNGHSSLECAIPDMACVWRLECELDLSGQDVFRCLEDGSEPPFQEVLEFGEDLAPC